MHENGNKRIQEHLNTKQELVGIRDEVSCSNEIQNIFQTIKNKKASTYDGISAEVGGEQLKQILHKIVQIVWEK